MRANCAIHLGIVHIEECGSAEYSARTYRSRRWRGYNDEDEENASSEDFEILEVTDGCSYIDHWLTPEDGTAPFSRLPLHEGEVLPAGALDNESPDEQRFLEASGNEGVSFERAYHRAALVIWPCNRFVDVLLQAGVRTALSYLEQRMDTGIVEAKSNTARLALLADARRVVIAWEGQLGAESKGVDSNVDFGLDTHDEEWESESDFGGEPVAGPSAESTDQSRMITLLRRLADAELLAQFVSSVVTARLDADEAAPLAASACLFGAQRCAEVFPSLIRHNIRTSFRGCVNLFALLVAQNRVPTPPEWAVALRAVAGAVVEGLDALAHGAPKSKNRHLSAARRGKPADGETLADLFDALAALEAPKLRAAACAAVVADCSPFDPRSVIVPALRMLHGRGRRVIGDAEFGRLWHHAADALLAQSEYPPEPPRDWRQRVKLSCNCEDCLELQAFAAHPTERTHRFSVRKDRRQHLHRQIEWHKLDMTHVTERKGSPQTLVCAKTRRTHLRLCDEYRKDVAALVTLGELVKDSPGELASHCARIAAAQERVVAIAE